MTTEDTTTTVEVLTSEQHRPHARAAVDFVRGMALMEDDIEELGRVNRVRERLDAVADDEPVTLAYDEGAALAAALFALRSRALDNDEYAKAARIEKARREAHNNVAEVDRTA